VLNFCSDASTWVQHEALRISVECFDDTSVDIVRECDDE
jgi:hypothetical protein